MKKLFMKKAPKEASDAENKEYLENAGISTYKGRQRERKFGGFSEYAKEVAARGKKDYNSKETAQQTSDVMYQRQQEQIYGPGGNPYGRPPPGANNAGAGGAAGTDNPYAAMGQTKGNPYADQGVGGGNPYANAPNAYLDTKPGASHGNSSSSNAYEAPGNSYAQAARQSSPQPSAGAGNPYAQAAGGSANPYAEAGGNPYESAAGGAGRTGGASNPYASAAPVREYAESTYAPSVAPSEARNELFGDRIRGGGPKQRQKEFDFGNDTELDELNDMPEDDEELDELNGLPTAGRTSTRGTTATSRTREQGSSNPYGDEHAGAYGEGFTEEDQEDEEVEELRQQIRFTKKESLASTQNTLRLAAEAEASGRNTLGMLGAQGERIANTEQSLALAKNQTKLATEKNAELARLNRSIFVPNVSNPFTSKRRLQEKEARIKSEYAQEQVAREHRRQTAFESERRVLDGLNANGVSYSETAMKHRKEQMRNNEGRKKFQFEADSEDEDLEDELELNMEGISNAAGRMKNLAKSMGDEVNSQNKRLERITRQTDELDVDVHINAARLASIN